MKFLDCEWISRTIATGPDAERGIVAPLGDPGQFAREYLEHERPFEPMPMPCKHWKGQWRDLAFRDLALRRLFVLLDVCYGIENERESRNYCCRIGDNPRLCASGKYTSHFMGDARS